MPPDDATQLELPRPRRWTTRFLGRMLERLRSTEMGAAIVSNASALASTTAVTSLLGVVYWFVAARRFTPASVGLATAAIAGMTLVSTFASLGLDTFVLGEVSKHPTRARPLIVAALICAGVAGLALGLGYALIAPVVSHELRPLSSTPFNATLFVGGTALVTVWMVLDQALVGQLRGSLQLWRNIVFGVSKLIILVIVSFGVARRSGMSIYASWILGSLVSMFALSFYAVEWLRGLARDVRRGEFPLAHLLREVGQKVRGHQVLNAALKIPIQALPLMVVGLVGTRANAGFYVAWLIMNFGLVLPGALASVLYAVSSADVAGFASRIRLTLSLSFAICVVVMLVLIPGAHLMLSVFGASYAASATATLQLLALSAFPATIKNHYVAVARVRGRISRALPLLWFGAALEFGFAAVGANIGGLTGLTAGWVIAITIESLLMAPSVFRAALVREGKPTPVQA
jgi:O-antigen/teichoic acid export membrane protein